ncbi:PKD domain-containing protein [Halorussus halophilus]|uniref:PKD domain-containing protein n=1 Tax=Halorussus halophilus TaxID=2650975 RepID=UPI001300DF3B|nr:PKD domain-containing protein [Halorussus halophilus]
MRRALVSVLLTLLVVGAPISGSVAATDTTSVDTNVTSTSANAADMPDLTERWSVAVGGQGDDKLTKGIRVDGGYLVVGWTDASTSDGRHDGYVALVDESGRTEWERTYGGSGTDRLFDVQATDGGYLLSGFESEGSRENSDGWVLKIDESGEVQWERTYGDDGPDAFWTLEQSGNAIYVGGWQKDGDTEAWLMELDRNGEEVWSEQYDTPRSSADEYINSLFVTNSGKLLLTGTIRGDGTDPSDAWVMKTDSEGELEWERTYGGAELNRIHDATKADGGFVLAGRSIDNGDDQQDAWALKIAGDGTVEWERTFGTPRDDAFYGVLADDDGGFVLSGAKNKLSQNGADGWMLKVDADGKKQWERSYGQRSWDKFWPVIHGNGGGYLAVGETTSYGDNRDGWLVRIGGPAVAAIEDSAPNASGSTVVLEGSPVRSVTLSDANVSGVLTVAEEADVSALSPPGRPVYAVTLGGPDALENGSATVEFSVPTEALDAELSDLRVAQRTDDGWVLRNTTLVSETNGTATLSADVMGTGTLAVTAVAAPEANIAGPQSVLVGEEITLDASGSSAENGTLESYEWSIAGATQSGETASATFSDLGETNVTLTVTDAAGLRDSATATVIVNDEPTASIDAPKDVSVGKAATFTADVTDEVGDVTVTWQFGDGEVTGTSVEHSFGTPGTKTVTVVVTDEYGASVTKELTVNVGQQDANAATDTSSGDGNENSGTIPGFTPVIAVVALLAAALLARRAA